MRYGFWYVSMQDANPHRREGLNPSECLHHGYLCFYDDSNSRMRRMRARHAVHSRIKGARIDGGRALLKTLPPTITAPDGAIVTVVASLRVLGLPPSRASSEGRDIVHAAFFRPLPVMLRLFRLSRFRAPLR